jgi:protein-S-isoprenylcysteine O-methyltransferase Ste14
MNDRAARVLMLALIILVTVRLLIGKVLFEQIWIALTAVIVGGMLLVGAGVAGLFICFGEAKTGVWLSPIHRRKQDIAFIFGAIVSAVCYYFYGALLR